MRFNLHAALAAVLLLPSTGAAAASPNPADAPAGHYELDPRHTAVVASVLHEGISHFTMRIEQVQGAFDYDPKAPQASKIVVPLAAHSLNTGDPAVSKQFAGEFLDADHNPTITFTSTGMQLTDANHGQVAGDLTFRGVTHPVTLDVTYNGFASSLFVGKRMGFSASTVIKRSEFGARAWESAVADDVRVAIEAEFVRK